MSDAPRGDRRRRAAEALDVARADPRRALELAASCVGSDDAVTAATAHLARGLAYRALSEGARSTSEMEAAAELAERAGDRELLGTILRSLAFNRAQAGDDDDADALIRRSIDLLDADGRALSRLQHAFILIMRGAHIDALEALNAALPAFDRPGAEDRLTLIVYNRAVIHMELGALQAADADLRRCFDVACETEDLAMAADAALHLSEVRAWLDDLPGAMEWHRRSAELRERIGAASPLDTMEYALILLQAGLLAEAEEALRSAIPALEAAGGNDALVVQARIWLAEVLARLGRPAEGVEVLDPAWALLAPESRFRLDVEATGLRLTAEMEPASAARAAAMEACARRMLEAGENLTAAALLLDAARQAGDAGEAAMAERLIARASTWARRGPLWLQIRLWSEVARLRRAVGNVPGAWNALHAARRRFARYRSAFGSADLRLHAERLAFDLHDLGVAMALGARSAGTLLGWVERLRADEAVAPRPAGGVDERVSALMARLRRLDHRLGLGDVDEELATTRRDLEASITEALRTAEGDRRAVPPPSVREIHRALGDATGLSFVELDGAVTVIVIDRGRTRLVDVGAVDDLVSTIAHLDAAFARVARSNVSARSLSAALATIDEGVADLRRRLLDPLGVPASSRLVVVPSPSLRAAPWSMLHQPPPVVVSSLTRWVRLAPPPDRFVAPCVIASRRLDSVSGSSTPIGAELAARVVPATVDEVVAALGRSDLAHVAAHAATRSDRPLFSYLALDDGHLYLSELAELGRMPSAVILAACDAGASAAAVGSAALGIADVFLTRGSSVVLAPGVPVSDAATRTVMERVHRQVAVGVRLSDALGSVIAGSDGPLRATAGAFVCFGRG